MSLAIPKQVRNDDMNEKNVRRQMAQVLNIFKEEIATIRTGRANPSLVEDVEVEAYPGQDILALKELGSIAVEEARSLIFQPWDKSIIKRIKNEILAQDLGVQATISGEVIRIKLPQLSTQQREAYLELLDKKLEAARVMIRNIRSEHRYTLQEQEREGEISEDEFYRMEKKLQGWTDEYIEKLEKLAEKKRKEIKGE